MFSKYSTLANQGNDMICIFFPQIDNVPDIVKSSTKKIEMELYDEFTIDREVCDNYSAF